MIQMDILSILLSLVVFLSEHHKVQLIHTGCKPFCRQLFLGMMQRAAGGTRCYLVRSLTDRHSI